MADENTTNEVTTHQYNLRFETADGSKTLLIMAPASDYQWNEKQWQLIFQVSKANHRGDEIEEIKNATGTITLYEDNTPVVNYYGYNNLPDNNYHDNYTGGVHNITLIQRDLLTERVDALEDAVAMVMGGLLG